MLHSTSEYIKSSQMELYLKKKNQNNTNNTASKLTNKNKISSVSLSPHILSSNTINKIHGKKNANTCCSTKEQAFCRRIYFVYYYQVLYFNYRRCLILNSHSKKFKQTHHDMEKVAKSVKSVLT